MNSGIRTLPKTVIGQSFIIDVNPASHNMTHLKSLKHSYLHRYQGHESLTYENPRFSAAITLNNNTLLLFHDTYTEFFSNISPAIFFEYVG